MRKQSGAGAGAWANLHTSPPYAVCYVLNMRALQEPGGQELRAARRFGPRTTAWCNKTEDGSPEPDLGPALPSIPCCSLLNKVSSR